MRVFAVDLAKHIGTQAQISGWLHKKRLLGGLTFIVIRDRSGLIQCVVQDEAEIEKLKGLQNGSILSVAGDIAKEDRAPNGAEIKNPTLTVVVPVTHVPPIEVDKSIDHNSESFDTLFEHRVINLRNVDERRIFKIQSAVTDAMREYLKSHDFTEFRSPKILAEATEGGAETFHIDYFGRDATLAQSAQFYKQMMVGVFERVFEIGPTFRAEPSTTTRHMSEFTTLDAEMGFADGLDELSGLLGGLMHHLAGYIWGHHPEDVSALGMIKPELPAVIPQITLAELHKLHKDATGTDYSNEPDPSPAEERWACEYALKKWQSDAVFITEFPASHMKFYHLQNEQNPKVAQRADLLFRGTEIATLSMREHRYSNLLAQMQSAGLDPSHPGLHYYLEAFKYGLPPHGGFGLGVERLTQMLIGLGNVKEATLFPRDMQRLAP